MTLWLRALFLEQTWLKLFSLLLATLLWLAVHANVESGARSFDNREAITNLVARPVMILTDSGAHSPVTVDPPAVDVSIRGGVAEIARLDPLDVRVFVRVPNRDEFDGTVPVYVQLPKHATLIMASPSFVRVRPVPRP